MNTALFIAKKISRRSAKTFSRNITAIAVTGIALGLAIMIISFAIIIGFKAEIRNKLIAFSGDIQIIKYDLNTSLENTPISIPEDKLSFLKKKFHDIINIQPFATKTGIIVAKSDIEGVILKGIGKDYDLNFYKEALTEGKIPDFNADSIVNELLISEYTAKRLKLNNGDYIKMYFIQEPLRVRKLRISGIYDAGIEDINKLYALGDIKLVKRLNSWQENLVGGYEIHIKDFDKIDNTMRKIIDNTGDDITAYSVKETYSSIFDWLSLLDVNTEVILTLMTLVAGINMISALLILILERTSMIGILKALGAENFLIRRIFIYKSAFIIIKGMIIGDIIGIGFCLLQKKFSIIKLDQASYYMDIVPIHLNIPILIALNIGIFLVCLIMLIIPSMLISGIEPIKAIKFK